MKGKDIEIGLVIKILDSILGTVIMSYCKMKRYSLIILMLFMIVIHFNLIYAVEDESDGNSSITYNYYNNTYNYNSNNTYNYNSNNSNKNMTEEVETIADNEEYMTKEIESTTNENNLESPDAFLVYQLILLVVLIGIVTVSDSSDIRM